MMLEFSGVGKTFPSPRGEVEAVRGVDLEVREGELFVLLGPSGCGKSTVLSLAAGLLAPSAGEIRLGGDLVAAPGRKVFVSPRERNVAMVFQSYALYPHLDVYGNIAFPLRVAGMKEESIRTEVARAAGMLGIGELLRARPGELSGGQRQRVAIARAVVRRPRLFLLDEPLSNLDAALRAATRAELSALQRALGVTTLYVTHDQTEATTLGDRVALMREGRVLQTGTPRELYERPRTPFAAAFIGPAPMNLVDAEAFEEGGRMYVRIGEGRIELPPGTAGEVRRLGTCLFVLGLRPERVRISGDPGPSALRGIVASAEYLGRERLVSVNTALGVLTVLTGEEGPKAGDVVGLDLPLETASVFRSERSSP
jgi:multiple sugar transport system ATP-binding protein